MVTGILASGGYSTGGNNWPADKNNPTGYYEERGLLKLNARILASQVPSPVELRAENHPDALEAPNEARWLSLIAPETQLSLEPRLLSAMKGYLENKPFCFKDPQFSYTLDLWKPILEDTRFICVFRSPADTARSIIRYCSRYQHFEPLNIDEAYAEAVWLHSYK